MTFTNHYLDQAMTYTNRYPFRPMIIDKHHYITLS